MNKILISEHVAMFYSIYICLLINIPLIQAGYIRLPTINCSESSAIGTTVVDLRDLLSSSNWEFTLLTETSIKTYFLLDALKGTIIIQRILDRENLCQQNLCSCLNQCLIKLEINAQNDTHTNILSLPISILDENDNYCYFLNEYYYIKISESIRLQSRISLPIAYDPDLTPNNIQSYGLLENNSTQFQFDNYLIPSLIVIKQLDRESIEKYHFIYCAYEGINEQKRSCCTNILLTITDVNDNGARFQIDQQLPFTINVSESSSINTEIIQMKAYDIDQGLNGQIRYTFSKWTLADRTINNIFYLDPTNGSVILLKELDYEQRNHYKLQVQAQDLGSNSIPTYTTLTIQVLDENDCTPEMFIFSPNNVELINNSIINIFENISINTAILYLTVSDGDTGENGHVNVELICINSILQLEQINNNTYILRTNAQFDREDVSFYSFTLVTYDYGEPKRTLINRFNLNIRDINDCSPYFDALYNYSFIIDENNEENFVLHTINVYDHDENDQVTLYIIYKDELEKDLFNINEQNQLIIVKPLDYETKTSYNFILTARDRAEHETSVLIHIYLNDLNDNPVKFLGNSTRFTLNENQFQGQLLYEIYAEDKDKNHQVTYTIHPDDKRTIEQFFQLNENGNLYTKKLFHQKSVQQLQFRVIANDTFYTDIMFIEIIIDNQSILKTQSPYCFIVKHNQTNEIHLETYRNVSFSLKNSSFLRYIRLLPNGTLILKSQLEKYSLDIYLQDDYSISLFENFVVLNQSLCQNDLLVELNQLILFICSITVVVLIIIFIGFYFHENLSKKSFDKQGHLTPSSSASMNDTLFFSSPSPQLTSMTIVSSSPTNQTNKLSSISSSTSYIKMTRSSEDVMI